MLIGGSRSSNDKNIVNVPGHRDLCVFGKEGMIMPFINIKVLKDTLSKEKKIDHRILQDSGINPEI
jgi:hypothetical protein